MLSEPYSGLLAHLPSFLAAQRWFGGKARQILAVEIVDVIPIGDGELNASVCIVRAKYLEGAEETYSIPLVPGPTEESGSSLGSGPELGSTPGSTRSFEDVFSKPQFLRALLDMIQEERETLGEAGRIRGTRAPAFSQNFSEADDARPRMLSGEQSNSSVIYGDRLILKFFRRLEKGINPDLEIGRFLTEKAHFPHIPRIAGSLEYQTPGGMPVTQAILQEFVPNQGDAWRYALKTLNAFYERVQERQFEDSGTAELSGFGGESMSRLLAEIALLGQRTAELHLALSSTTDDPGFAPEPFTREFQRSLQASFETLTRETLGLLRARSEVLPGEYKAKASAIASREPEIVQAFRTALSTPVNALRIRIHGDYHLGQVLYTGSDFVIIDFEGEPARPLVERRVKQSPLQDVAGMLRSFHYAAFAPLVSAAGGTALSQSQVTRLGRWAEAWSRCAASRFLGRYYERSGTAGYLPLDPRERARLLETYLLAKAIYELGYELNNRPAWVGIPLEGISRLLSLPESI